MQIWILFALLKDFVRFEFIGFRADLFVCAPAEFFSLLFSYIKQPVFKYGVVIFRPFINTVEMYGRARSKLDFAKGKHFDVLPNKKKQQPFDLHLMNHNRRHHLLNKKKREKHKEPF